MSGILAQDEGGPLMSEDKFDSSFAGIFDDDFHWSFMELFVFLAVIYKGKDGICAHDAHVFDLYVAGKLGRFSEIAALGTRLSVLGMRQGVIGYAG